MQCSHAGCEDLATFAITAAGYPMPMMRACTAHIGACLVDDLSAPGSTRSWVLTPVAPA